MSRPVLVVGAEAATPIYSLASTAQLVNQPSDPRNTRVHTLGASTPGDGGGGVYRFDAGSTLAPDGEVVIQPTGLTVGRWLRVAANTSDRPRVNSHASLKALAATGVADALGHSTPGDGGGGTFYLDSDLAPVTITCNLSNANHADGSSSRRKVTGSGFTDALAGCELQGTGITAGVRVVRVVSATELWINKPAGTTSASLAVTFEPDDGGSTLKGAHGGYWRRVHDGAVNVLWYGAQPDWTGNELTGAGSGSDNLAAFERAMAAACGPQFWSGRVIVPPGRYGIGGPLTIPKSGMVLEGAGLYGAMLLFTTAGGGIRFERTPSTYDYCLTLRNLHLNGCGVAQTGLRVTYVEECFASNVIFWNFTQVGLDLVEAGLSYFDGLAVSQCPTSVRLDTCTHLQFRNANFYKADTASFELRGIVQAIDFQGFIEDSRTIWLADNTLGEVNAGSLRIHHSRILNARVDGRLFRVTSSTTANALRVTPVVLADCSIYWQNSDYLAEVTVSAARPGVCAVSARVEGCNFDVAPNLAFFTSDDPASVWWANNTGSTSLPIGAGSVTVGGLKSEGGFLGPFVAPTDLEFTTATAGGLRYDHATGHLQVSTAFAWNTVPVTASAVTALLPTAAGIAALPVSDPPTKGEVEGVRDALGALAAWCGQLHLYLKDARAVDS